MTTLAPPHGPGLPPGPDDAPETDALSVDAGEIPTAGGPPVPPRPSLVRRLFDLVAPERDAELPAPPPGHGNHWEVKLLTVVSLVVYGFVGWWLRHYLHFAVGDALARTANAKYMLFARDAHFAALGFVWMPIPTVSQIPAMLICEPLGYAADAGWITTAFWGAATVLILGRICRDLGLRRLTTLLLICAYAFNPVIVYYAANGMSEGPLFTFIALTFLGVLRYLRRGDTAALVVTAFGLLGCALDRYEAIPLIVFTGVVLLVADLRRTGRWSALLATSLTVLPGLGSVAIWFLYMKVIKGSFRAFITDAAGNAAPAAAVPAASAAPPAAPAAPVPYSFYKDIAHGQDWLHYTLHWCFSYSPALFVLPLLLIPPFRRTAGAVALVIFAVWLPGVTAYLLRFGGSAGDPRYFTSTIITGAIGVIFLASRVNVRYLRLVVHPALMALLVLGWVTGTHAQYDRVATGQEGEWRVFDVAQGRIDRGDTRNILAWQRFADTLDATLRPGQIVFDDVRFSFEAELDSRKPKQFIINNDSDFDSIRDNPYRAGVRIDYLIVPATGQRGDGSDYGQVILDQDPAAWREIASPGPALIYQRVAGVAGPGPSVGVEGAGTSNG